MRIERGCTPGRFDRRVQRVTRRGLNRVRTSTKAISAAPGRLDARIRIFVNQAFSRIHMQPPGGLEKHVGSRFMVRYFLGADHRVEPAGQPDLIQDRVQNRPGRSGRHGDRQAASILPGNRHDRLDRGYLGQSPFEGGFFLVGDLPRFGRTAGLAHQQLGKCQRGPTAERVEAILGELQAIAHRGIAPGLEVHRHRVGQRSVAIENNGVDLSPLPTRGRNVPETPA